MIDQTNPGHSIAPQKNLFSLEKSQLEPQMRGNVEALVDSFQNLITPIAWIGAEDFQDYWILQSGKLQDFRERVEAIAGVPEAALDRIAELHKEAHSLFHDYQQLLCDLEKKNYARMNLSLTTAQRFKRGLSLACAQALQEALEHRLLHCDPDDICRYACQSFLAVLRASEEGLASPSDRNLLTAFSDLQQTFPSMARDLSSKLQAYFHGDSETEEMLGYGLMGGSFQRALVQLLPENQLCLLRYAFGSRLQRLLDMTGPEREVDKIESQWQVFARWMCLFQDLPGESQEALREQQERLSQRALHRVERLLTLVEKDMMGFLQEQVQPHQRDYSRRCTLFVSLFGDEFQKSGLIKVMDALLGHFRQALASTDLDEETLTFLDNLGPVLVLGGQAQQRIQVRHLLYTWRQYRSHLISRQVFLNQALIPYTVRAHYHRLRTVILQGLEQHHPISKRDLNALEQHLSHHSLKQGFGLDQVLAKLSNLSICKARWWRQIFCESQQAYVAYALLMLSKIDHEEQAWAQTLERKEVRHEALSEEIIKGLVHFSQTLTQQLGLGRRYFPRVVEEAIHEVGF